MLHLGLLNLSTLGNALMTSFSNMFCGIRSGFRPLAWASGTGYRVPVAAAAAAAFPDPSSHRRTRWPFSSLDDFRYAWRKNFARLFVGLFCFVDAFVLFEAYRDVYLTRSLVCPPLLCASFFVIVCVILCINIASPIAFHNCHTFSIMPTAKEKEWEREEDERVRGSWKSGKPVRELVLGRLLL